MASDDFYAAVDLLDWVADASLTHDAQAHRVGASDSPKQVRRPQAEPAVTMSARRSALSMTGPGIGPVVVVGWPFARLPEKGWQDGYLWGSAGRWVWMPEDQPQGPTLYRKPARLNLIHDGPAYTPSDGSRSLSIAVLADPTDAPSTMAGTRALVAAVIASDTSAHQLRAAAESGEYRADTARRFRPEAEALTDHARASEAQIKRTLGWVADFERSLAPIPPFAPLTVPATIRVAVGVTP